MAGSLLAPPLTAEPQQAGKVARIGVLGDTSPPVETSYSGIAAFRQGLRELGCVEGRHVTIEYRWAEGQRGRLPDLATDFVRSRVDVVLALGPASARAAKNATTTIPVVFVGSGDPIPEGLVASLARPAAKLPPVRVALPDGTTVTSDQDDLNQILSKALNLGVKFRAAQRGAINAEEYWPDMEGLDHRDTITDFTLPEGTFFDVAVVHLLTTAPLDRLRELYPRGRFEVRWFRPNIMLQLASGEKVSATRSPSGRSCASSSPTLAGVA